MNLPSSQKVFHYVIINRQHAAQDVWLLPVCSPFIESAPLSLGIHPSPLNSGAQVFVVGGLDLRQREMFREPTADAERRSASRETPRITEASKEQTQSTRTLQHVLITIIYFAYFTLLPCVCVCACACVCVCVCACVCVSSLALFLQSSHDSPSALSPW